MPTRKQRSLPEQYPYHPIHHVAAVVDSPDGGQTIVTNFKYPDGQPVRFYVYLEMPDRTVVWDRGEIAIHVGAETYGYGGGFYDDEFGYWRERYFSDAQIEHWRALNFIDRTAFGDGPAGAMSILAGGSNRDMALAKIISATRNFIAAEVKGR